MRCRERKEKKMGGEERGGEEREGEGRKDGEGKEGSTFLLVLQQT